MAGFDVTKTNVAVERLLEVTENPRHHYLLEAYNRHRYLEMAGRYPGDLLAADDRGPPGLPLRLHRAAADQARRSRTGRGALPRMVHDGSVHLLPGGRGRSRSPTT